MTQQSPTLELTGDGLLGGLSHQTFLSTYWQKHPVLIRNALPGYQSPLSGDELAGLACEAEVESRLVLQTDGASAWHLEHGPFAEQRFADLPASHWSLLVQGCEKHVPELADLLESFDFIPHWRIDDIMVSFAPEQGSVGPHVDQYDVFLIQAQGTRRWQINTTPVQADNFIPGIDLHILRDFEAEHEWVVRPGDMLYLPPGVAHFGLALENCITLSVGFRAPSHADIVGAYLDDAIHRLPAAARYTDPDLIRQPHPGEISNRSVEQVRQIVRSAVADDAAIDDWFGRYVTEPKADTFSQDEEHLLIAELTPAAFAAAFQTSGELQRHPDCRVAFRRQPEFTTLYIHGERFRLSPELTEAAARLADHATVAYQQLAEASQQPAFLELLTELYNRGFIRLPHTEFHLARVTWSQAEKPLRSVRSLVFIHEQKVPAELEWDDEDEHAIHLLAISANGQAIGTVRLLADGHIGRLAVIPQWRKQGVGHALMLAILKIARAQGMAKALLNAQTRAIDFYQRLGFSVDSHEFMEAGIPHRRMTLELPPDIPNSMTPADETSEYDGYQLGRNSDTLFLSLREQHTRLCLQMARQATRTLHIFSYDLDASVFDNQPFLDAVKQLAIGSTNSRIYILLQEPRDIILHGHRIVELARRLSSHILIHRADEEDRKRLDNFFIADEMGLIRRPHSNRYEGTADFNKPADARLLLKYFEEAWERSQPDPELRRLHL